MKKHKTLFGIIVIISIIFLIIISIYMNQIRFNFNMKHIIIKFKSVNGLRVDDEVRVRGLKSGNVENIQLMDDYVIVEIQIKKDIFIAKNTLAAIHDFAIIGGTKYIMLYPGDRGEYFYPEDTLLGKNYDFSIAKISMILENIQSSINNIIPEKKRIDSIMLNINTLIKESNQLIKITGLQLTDITYDVKKTAKQVNSILDTLMYSINILKAQFDDYNKNTNTIKRLSSNDSLYIQLKQSIDKLNRILDKLNKNKFIKGCL